MRNHNHGSLACLVEIWFSQLRVIYLPFLGTFNAFLGTFRCLIPRRSSCVAILHKHMRNSMWTASSSPRSVCVSHVWKLSLWTPSNQCPHVKRQLNVRSSQQLFLIYERLSSQYVFSNVNSSWWHANVTRLGVHTKKKKKVLKVSCQPKYCFAAQNAPQGSLTNCKWGLKRFWRWWTVMRDGDGSDTEAASLQPCSTSLITFIPFPLFLLLILTLRLPETAEDAAKTCGATHLGVFVGGKAANQQAPLKLI